MNTRSRSGKVYCDSMINKQTNTTFQKVLLFFVIVVSFPLGTCKAPKFSMGYFWVHFGPRDFFGF